MLRLRHRPDLGENPHVGVVTEQVVVEDVEQVVHVYPRHLGNGLYGEDRPLQRGNRQRMAKLLHGERGPRREAGPQQAQRQRTQRLRDPGAVVAGRLPDPPRILADCPDALPLVPEGHRQGRMALA